MQCNTSFELNSGRDPPPPPPPPRLVGHPRLLNRGSGRDTSPPPHTHPHRLFGTSEVRTFI